MSTAGNPVVVGYIETPEGQAALNRAVAEARLRGATLVIVNSGRGGSSRASQEPGETDELLGAIRDQIRASGVDVEVRQLVRGNDPAEDLIAAADELEADLIVIGLRRRSPVGKLVLGSNSQQVLLEANCPVLAVKIA